MSEGLAPAVDKVGAPEPTAPTMDTTKPKGAVEEAGEASAEEAKATERAKPAPRVPRPVEVVSVPQTPVNIATPTDGIPRPELNIPLETTDVKEPGVQEPLPTPTASVPNSAIAPEPMVDKPVTPNGDSEMTGVLQTGQDDQKSDASETAAGEKRKLEDAAAEAPAETERADKKAKVDTNGGHGRPAKKDKKDNKDNKNAAPFVGRTARKTRSQGPVET